MDVRIDPITGEPVLFATKRAKRPHFGTSKTPHPKLDKHRTEHPLKKVDPFGVGNESITDKEVWADSDDPKRKADKPGWRIRVIPNKYPIVDHHEVIILTPSPSQDIAGSSAKQTERIVAAFLERAKEHQKKGQVFIFANHGAAAGASISHPHAQLMVFPTMPPALKDKVEAVKEHYDKKGQCLYCQLLTKEIKIKKRMIWENEDFALMCPEASGWPYTIMLLPKVHQACFTSLQPEQVKTLAEAMSVMLKLYKEVLEDPPYNYWIHSVKGHFFHWHIELVPRTKTLAGVELGAGIMVNDRITPEDAAAQFRAGLKNID